MNKDRRVVVIHDVASLLFLAPFSALCVADVFFNYKVYPMFITHTLATYMSYDLMWIILQPKIIHTLKNLIILHHLVVLLALIRPLMYPEEAFILSFAGLVEIDTSLLIIRRLTPRDSYLYPTIDQMYHTSNVIIRVGYETCMTLLLWVLYARESMYTKLHVLGCQYFINIFSCGICALTFSKRNPALKEI